MTTSGTRLVQRMTDDFETNWRRARQQVQLYCYRAAGNRDDGEDIFQQAAVRAWRGYASFRGDCAFVSWAIAIAKREVARVMGRKCERAASRPLSSSRRRRLACCRASRRRRRLATRTG